MLVLLLVVHLHVHCGISIIAITIAFNVTIIVIIINTLLLSSMSMSAGQVNLSLGQQGNAPDLQVVSVRSVNQLPGMKIRQMCFVTLIIMVTCRR